jgi:tRNA 2-thiocytidine biosynthesis protein TtcA
MSKYAEREIRRLLGKAIHSRNMIESGDHVLVSVSGGKDSMSLLWLLRERIKRIPIEYRITAVHIDPGFGANSAAKMRLFFEDNGFDYRIVESDFGPKAHGPDNLENPCFLCSRLRRKALFELAEELQCGKIAFGHHKDDLIETFFLNIFYGASISTMMPAQKFFNGELTVVRPLFMVDEKMIEKFSENMAWPPIELGCPTAGSSKREEVKKMLRHFYGGNRKIKGNIFHALQNVRPEYLP